MNQRVAELIAELPGKIVATLGLDEVDPAGLGPDAPLFGAGLGLDSIDALELVVLLERDYGVKLTEMETARAAFATVRTLAEFVAARQADGAE